MGRKRNQGKARKAAKAKARGAAEESNNNHQVTNEQQQLLAAKMQRLQVGAPIPPSQSQELSNPKCMHAVKADGNTSGALFIRAFQDAFKCRADEDAHLSSCLIAAEDVTKDKFADVWNDSDKIESVISFFLSMGTHYILEGKNIVARGFAVFARYVEQRTAVGLYQTQALVNWPKIQEMFDSDVHTLVKFCRKRIPCSCLDEKYEEVKDTTKMGFCYNPKCKFPNRMSERRNTMYCSRCRCVTYCSPGCQKADWKLHRSACDKIAAMKAKFDAKQQNT